MTDKYPIFPHEQIGAKNVSQRCTGRDFGMWSRLFGPRFFGPVRGTDFGTDLKLLRIFVQTGTWKSVLGGFSDPVR